MLQPLQTVSDTQSARGLQAPKIADSSDNLHVFATGSKEERRQQLPNTVYTIGQQENTRTVASEQTAPVVNLDTPSVSSLHIEKIANIGVISRTFGSNSKEEHPQQLPNTVYTTGQQENTRTVASEQTATVANLDTPSVSTLHIEKIANIGVISRTFAIDSKGECPQQLSDTVCSIEQQENTCAVASDHTAAVANLATQSVRGLHVDKIANSGAILRAFATGNDEQCHQREVRRLQKSLTTALFCKLLQLAAKKKVYRSCPACLAPVGNDATHAQMRQNRLQPL